MQVSNVIVGFAFWNCADSCAEIMEILKTKKAQSPPPSSASRKKKSKYLSAEAVNDVDDVEMSEGQPQAGPSSGSGTLASVAS